MTCVRLRYANRTYAGWFHWDYRKCERMKNPDNCGMVVLERGADGKYDLASPVEFRAAQAGKLREPQPV